MYGVIAFGGGSGIDVGKAIAFICIKTRPIWDFEDIKIIGQELIIIKLPIIAVPTTTGTGSNRKTSAIINKKTNKKIFSLKNFYPQL